MFAKSAPDGYAAFVASNAPSMAVVQYTLGAGRGNVMLGQDAARFLQSEVAKLARLAQAMKRGLG